MPVAAVNVIRHIVQSQLLSVMLPNIRKCACHDIVSGLSDVPVVQIFVRLRLFRNVCLRVEGCRHVRDRLLQFFHAAWFDKITEHPEPYCLLRVIKITVSGQDRDFHSRKLALQRRYHLKSIHKGHADIREENVWSDFVDKLQPFATGVSLPDNLTSKAAPVNGC